MEQCLRCKCASRLNVGLCTAELRADCQALVSGTGLTMMAVTVPPISGWADCCTGFRV